MDLLWCIKAWSLNIMQSIPHTYVDLTARKECTPQHGVDKQRAHILQPVGGTTAVHGD